MLLVSRVAVRQAGRGGRKKNMPAVVADPLRWRGEGLANHSALSYCNRKEEDIQRLLKSPQLFPCFYCTAEILQGRRKKKDYLKRRYP